MNDRIKAVYQRLQKREYRNLRGENEVVLSEAFYAEHKNLSLRSAARLLKMAEAGKSGAFPGRPHRHDADDQKNPRAFDETRVGGDPRHAFYIRFGAGGEYFQRLRGDFNAGLSKKAGTDPKADEKICRGRRKMRRAESDGRLHRRRGADGEKIPRGSQTDGDNRACRGARKRPRESP